MVETSLAPKKNAFCTQLIDILIPGIGIDKLGRAQSYDECEESKILNYKALATEAQ